MMDANGSPDAHFATKLASCSTKEELDAMRAAVIDLRGINDHERHQFDVMRQHLVLMDLQRQKQGARA